MTDATETYRELYDDCLQAVAEKLEGYVRDAVAEMKEVDRISARAKDPDRFAEKASRKNEDGSDKYERPLTEIQDQVGVRIVVFYKKTVAPVEERVLKYFRHIEAKDLVPESPWQFGYFGRHFVLALPEDVIPSDADVKQVPRFFELQIKTLFQHAWSEANHDLGYKAPTELNDDQERRLAFTAAQAWGADLIFDELHTEIG